MKFNVINVIIVVKISIPKKTRKTRKFSFKSMFIMRQTLQDLATKYNKSIQWVHYKIKEFEPQIKIHNQESKLNL